MTLSLEKRILISRANLSTSDLIKLGLMAEQDNLWRPTELGIAWMQMNTYLLEGGLLN